MKDPEKIKERKIEIKKSKMLVSLGITKEKYEKNYSCNDIFIGNKLKQKGI